MQSAAISARIDIISCDELYPAAEAISKEIPLLTSSQISGFKNIARSAPSSKEIQDYINHQKEKTKGMAKEKGLVEEKYWDGIIKELRSIAKRAKELGEEMALDKKDKSDFELTMVREFIYHLAAEQKFRLQR